MTPRFPLATAPCIDEATSPCGNQQAAPSCAARISLGEVFDRHGREASQGSLDTGRYRCRYYAWGSGPALVFVPGLCDDRLSFLMPIARLNEHFRCISYDLPAGKGDGATLARYRHADLVDDLLVLLDRLDVGEAFLFGSSFGSTIVLEALRRQPKRFPRAILQGGFARRPLAFAEIMLAAFARFWPWNMNSLPWRETFLRRAHAASFSDRAGESWDFFLSRFGAPPMAAVAQRALMISQLDLRWALPEIRQPVLLICGDADPVVGRSCEADLLRGLPKILRAEIERCGHLPHFTHPEVMAEVVRGYLAQPHFDAEKNTRFF